MDTTSSFSCLGSSAPNCRVLGPTHRAHYDVINAISNRKGLIAPRLQGVAYCGQWSKGQPLTWGRLSYIPEGSIGFSISTPAT